VSLICCSRAEREKAHPGKCPAVGGRRDRPLGLVARWAGGPARSSGEAPV